MSFAISLACAVDTPARVRSSMRALVASLPAPVGITGSSADVASSACFAANLHRSNAWGGAAPAPLAVARRVSCLRSLSR